jgi:hypothetical protein
MHSPTEFGDSFASSGERAHGYDSGGSLPDLLSAFGGLQAGGDGNLRSAKAPVIAMMRQLCSEILGLSRGHHRSPSLDGSFGRRSYHKAMGRMKETSCDEVINKGGYGYSKGCGQRQRDADALGAKSEMVKEWDKDCKGGINVSELNALYKAIGGPSSMESAQSNLKFFDRDKNGMLDKYELASNIILIDQNRDGRISGEEYAKAKETYGQQPEQAQAALAAIGERLRSRDGSRC